MTSGHSPETSPAAMTILSGFSNTAGALPPMHICKTSGWKLQKYCCAIPITASRKLPRHAVFPMSTVSAAFSARKLHRLQPHSGETERKQQSHVIVDTHWRFHIIFAVIGAVMETVLVWLDLRWRFAEDPWRWTDRHDRR